MYTLVETVYTLVETVYTLVETVYTLVETFSNDGNNYEKNDYMDSNGIYDISEFNNVSLTLSNSISTVEYNHLTETLSIESGNYQVGNSLILDGKKVTILDLNGI